MIQALPAVNFATLNFAYAAVCLIMLALWGARTWRSRKSGRRDARGWLVPVGVLLLWAGLQEETDALVGIGVGLALIGELWPGARERRAPLPEFVGRWQAAPEPPVPDLELHLEESGARVLNVSNAPLFVHGWSPASTNGWLKLRADDGSGEPVLELRAGESARLSPWPMPNRGVRVWYARQDEPQQALLFHAEWNEPNRARRELN